MRTTDYIDALRVATGTPSDYALAKFLGVQQNQIARYRKGGTFDNSMAARAAELLNLQPLEVIADMELERARTDAQRNQWATLLSRITKAAAATAPALLLAPHLAELSPLFILC